MQIRAHQRRTAMTVGALGLVLLPGSPASAAAPDRFTFDHSDSFRDSPCGVYTQIDVAESGRGMIRVLPDGQAYFTTWWEGHITWTNLKTKKTVNLYGSFIDRDSKITDNGDGTITILAHSNYVERDYGPDGTLAFQTSGRETTVWLVDLNGTPDNFDDDEVLEVQFIGFAGRNDRENVDFCDWYTHVTA